MFSIPQDVLRTVLSIKNTTPQRLSEHETAIANRICHCTLCDALWVRRSKLIPDRCPKCHKRAWDRPLLSAMMQNAPPQRTPLLPQYDQSTSPPDLPQLPEGKEGKQS